MSKLRNEVSAILGFGITTDWDTSIKSLNRDGRLSQKQIIELLILLLKREEARENAK